VAAPALPKRLIKASRELLRATDELGLEAQGAGWLYEHELGTWRYFLITGLVNTEGRRRVYRDLLRAFDRLGSPEGLSIVDVHLSGQEHPVFAALGRLIDLSGDSVATFANCVLNGIPFDAVMYRWTEEVPASALRKSGRRFAKNVRTLLAA
jgi:hypothetical protein